MRPPHSQQRRMTMNNKKRIIGIAQLTLTAVVALGFTGHAQARNHHSPDKIVVVGPADLPELARVTGQAMMLHDTTYGRTIRYSEQEHGARPASRGVADRGHVKAEGSAQVDGPAAIDLGSS